MLDITKKSLKKAIKKNELIPYIQPIVDATTYKIIGGEVLLRWEHPLVGTIYPDKFITLAERSGLIVKITRHLLSKVGEHIRENLKSHQEPFHLSINIDYSHLKDSDFISDCLSFLDRSKNSNIKLILELTEHEKPISMECIDININSLKKAGVCFALDDFGSGYSNFLSLYRYPIDYIKIDKQLSQTVATDIKSQQIVENIITISKNLNINTIVEGVEKKCQARYMRSLGAKYLQGYLYGRPLPLSVFFCSFIKN